MLGIFTKGHSAPKREIKKINVTYWNVVAVIFSKHFFFSRAVVVPI